MSLAETLQRAPANRVGQILGESRLRTGVDLETIAQMSNFTVGELSDIEAGHRSPDSKLIAQVSSVYDANCGLVMPERRALLIDLSAGQISADGHVMPLASASEDHVLEQYLSLVYAMRRREPGSRLPLRDEDMAILASSLSWREADVVDQLNRAMGIVESSRGRLRAWIRNHLWLSAAGGAFSALSVGTLLLSTGDASAGAEAMENVEPEPEPGSVLGRLILPASVSFTDGPSESVTVEAAVVDSSVVESIVVDSSVVDDESATARVEETAVLEPAPAVDPLAEIGAQAEALLPAPIEVLIPGWTVTYLPERAGYRGLTFHETKAIEVYVQNNDTAESLAEIVAHEVGHAVDISRLNNADRLAWLDERGIQDHAWWPATAAPDFQFGAGDFAEAFAVWAVGDQSNSEIAGQPTAAQLQVLEALTGL